MTTATVLQAKSAFFSCLSQCHGGTATGGDANRLIDSALISNGSESWPVPLENRQIIMESGAATGNIRRIGKVIHEMGELRAVPAFSAAVAAADIYELWGPSPHGGADLLKLINDTIRDLRYIKQTQVTIVNGERVYDVSTLVTDWQEIREVRVHYLDTQSLEPYDRRSFDSWTAHNEPSVTGTAVKLLIHPTLTVSTPANLELWLEHYAGFTPFVADTSTFDAQYLDWLAWETAMEWAKKMRRQSADAKAWQAFYSDALNEAMARRRHFNPPTSTRANHSWYFRGQ